MLANAKALALMLSLLASGVYGAGLYAGDETSPELAPPLDAGTMECAAKGECGYVAIGMMVRWGLLGPRERGPGEDPGPSGEDLPPMDDMDAVVPGEPTEHRGPPMVPWDGFVQVTRGGVKLVKPLLFERGGEYRWGGDDLIYPRNNRFTLEWRSSTTTHWDGVLVVIVVPKTRDPMAHVTLHTDQWSHVFEAAQLIGLHVRFPVTPMGHEMEINGFIVEWEPEHGQVAIIKLMVRWGYLEPPERDESTDDPLMPEEPDEPTVNRTRRMVPWDGFISTTKGGVKLLRPLLFETNGSYENGTDDLVYPRNNRFTLEWRSSTTVHWDGVLVALAIPIRAVPEAHVTIHTDQWSHVFDAHQLVGLHVRFPVTPMGHEMEINGWLVERKDDGENRGFRLTVDTIAGSEDGVENDAIVRAWKSDAPLEGVEVYINDELVGLTGEDGSLLIEDLEPGEYAVAAGIGEVTASAAFEVGE